MEEFDIHQLLGKKRWPLQAVKIDARRRWKVDVRRWKVDVRGGRWMYAVDRARVNPSVTLSSRPKEVLLTAMPYSRS